MAILRHGPDKTKQDRASHRLGGKRPVALLLAPLLDTLLPASQLALGRDAAVRLHFGNRARSGSSNPQSLKEIAIDFLQRNERTGRRAGDEGARLLACICATTVLIALAQPAHAASTPTASADDRRNAFALGYVLENSHQSAFEFIDAVKQLRDVNDDAQAGKMVDSLTVRGEVVRCQERDSFRQAADLMRKLHAPSASVKWADRTADSMEHPIQKGPRGVESEELVTEHLSAIIDETGRVQKEMLATLVRVVPALRSRYGASAVWAFDAGTFDAKVKHWSGDVADIPLLRKEAAHLVSTEPSGTPADVDNVLRAILPGDSLPTLQKGRGNLSALLPESSIHQAAIALRAAPDILTTNYNAADLIKQTDDVK